jgi:hypothetical protein
VSSPGRPPAGPSPLKAGRIGHLPRTALPFCSGLGQSSASVSRLHLIVAPAAARCAVASSSFCTRTWFCTSQAIERTEVQRAQRRGESPMSHMKTSTKDAAVIERVSSIPTTTAAALYLTTHSVLVTAIGTLASTFLTWWSLWLSDQMGRRRSPRVSPSDCERRDKPVPGRLKPGFDQGGGLRHG